MSQRTSDQHVVATKEHVGREGTQLHVAPTSVHCLSNPYTLEINELVWGVTSADILFHLNADKSNGSVEPGSRLRRIAQYSVTASIITRNDGSKIIQICFPIY